MRVLKSSMWVVCSLVAVWLAACRAVGAAPHTVKVESIHGAPTITIDGQPFRPVGWVLDCDDFWNSLNPLEHYDAYLDWLRANGYNTLSVAVPWMECVGQDGSCDFAPIIGLLKRCADRDIFVILRLASSRLPSWYMRKYRPDFMQNYRGKVINNGSFVFANPPAYIEMAEWIKKLIPQVKNSPALLGYSILLGTSGENNYPAWTDYSKPFVAQWWSWLRLRYKTDERLREAWRRPAVSLDAPPPAYPLDETPDVVDRRPEFRDWTEFRLEVKRRGYDFIADAIRREDPNHILCAFYSVALLPGCAPDSPWAGSFAAAATADFDYWFLRNDRIDVFRHAFLPAWDTPYWGRRADLPSVALINYIHQFAELCQRHNKLVLGEWGGGGINVPPGQPEKFRKVLEHAVSWYTPAGATSLPFILNHFIPRNQHDARSRLHALARTLNVCAGQPASPPLRSSVALLRASWSQSFTYTRSRDPGEWKTATDFEGMIHLLLDAAIDFDLITESEILDDALDRYRLLIVAGMHTWRFPLARKKVIDAVANREINLLLQGPLLEDGDTPTPDADNLGELLGVPRGRLSVIDNPRLHSFEWLDTPLTKNIERREVSFADASLKRHYYPLVLGLEKESFRPIARYDDGHPALLAKEHILFCNPPIGSLYYERRQRNVPLEGFAQSPKPFQSDFIRLLRNLLNHWQIPQPLDIFSLPPYITCYANRDYLVLLSRRKACELSIDIDLSYLGWPTTDTPVMYSIFEENIRTPAATENPHVVRMPVQLSFAEPVMFRLVRTPAVQVLLLPAKGEKETIVKIKPLGNVPPDVVIHLTGRNVFFEDGASRISTELSQAQRGIRICLPKTKRFTFGRLEVHTPPGIDCVNPVVVVPIKPGVTTFAEYLRERRGNLSVAIIWMSLRTPTDFSGGIEVDQGSIENITGLSLDPEQGEVIDLTSHEWNSRSGGGIDGIVVHMSDLRPGSTLTVETHQGNASTPIKTLFEGPYSLRVGDGLLSAFIFSDGLFSL